MPDNIPQMPDVIPADLADITFDPGTSTHTAEWFRLENRDLLPVKYVTNIGWHTWDGKCWRPDPEGLAALRLVSDFIRKLNKVTFGQSYNKKYTLESAYLHNIMKVLQVMSTTSATDMDALPSYLNCQNGVLDLTTFELEPHNADLNMTMCTEAEYTGEVDPLWSNFVEEILPDPEIRAYLQRLIGVSLIGEVLLHTLPILQGSGSNGKSTMMMAVAHALGSYSRIAEPTLLMTKQGDAQSATPATLMLKGKRLVIASETEDGKKLASAFVKQITGGDTLTARALHKMPVTWVPTHSVFLLTNPMPVVDGSDKALFRRLKVVPFSVVFPPDQIDEHLPGKLRLLTSSILSWAVEGLKDYQANGIQEPASVTNATDSYRGDSDALALFLAQYLEFGTGTESVRDIGLALHEFQQDGDPRNRITKQKLNRALKEGGAVQGRIRIGGVPTSVWNGVSLK